MYIVYILKCSDSTFYTWITIDIERRIKEHNGELSWWAKYTKSRSPVFCIYKEIFKNRSEATKREIKIKKMTQKKKLELINMKEVITWFTDWK